MTNANVEGETKIGRPPKRGLIANKVIFKDGEKIAGPGGKFKADPQYAEHLVRINLARYE